jgi:hypothetical protein
VFHKILRIPWLDYQLLAPQEGLSSMLVTNLLLQIEAHYNKAKDSGAALNRSTLLRICACTGCGRNNSHISINHCGVPKAVSGVWSVPLGREHNKVFSCRHTVVGRASRLCSGSFFKKFPPFGHSEQTKFSLMGC